MKKMEMQELLSMGFSDELAAQALAATGGKCTLKATEWILSRKSSDSTNSNSDAIPSPSLTPSQPKIDRFFPFQSTKPQSKREKEASDYRGELSQPQSESNVLPRKRPIQEHKNESPLSGSCKRNSLSSSDDKQPHEPLSERMRPRTIDEVVGQDHLLADKSLLRSAIDCNRLPSILLWGPPGTGKTSIARAIVNSSAHSTYRFVSLSAITSGVKDVRDAVEEARKSKLKNKRTVLFVDEVHRFNKSQQDSFLPVIEDGSIIFVGATTENPSFHLIKPLLSRCRVLTLKSLEPHHIAALLRRASADPVKGLAQSTPRGTNIEVNDDAIEFLSTNCDGDARVALNALEISATTAAGAIIDGNSATVTLDNAKEALQCKHLAYDKAGEQHYNLISALIKSMRGSDGDAAIYWLARMLEGGEEPLFIARRLIVFASEDVGLADPSALTQAVACYQACHFIGMPECNLNLAQCVAYMALAPKSIAVYKAIGAAQKVVKESIGQNEGVPLHLRNASTKLMQELGYGKGYIYPPNDTASSSSQTYLPPSLQGYKFLNLPNSPATKTER